MKKILISILNYNGNKNTLECLESLQEINRQDMEIQIIVVDNNSKDPFTLPKNDKGTIPIDIVYNSKNTGFAGGHNTVLKIAVDGNYDYVLVLNNDTVVEKDFLIELKKAMDFSANIGVCVPKIYFAKGHEFHKRYTKEQEGKVFWYAGGAMDWKNILGYHRGVDEVDSGQYDVQEETEFGSGCCMLISVLALRSVGFFDEKYFLYYEDTDLQARMHSIGYTVLYVPKSIIWHKNASSAGGSGSSLQDYFITRNRLLFGMRHGPIRARLALVKEALLLIINGRPMQKQGARDYFLGKLGKGSVIHD